LSGSLVALVASLGVLVAAVACTATTAPVASSVSSPTGAPFASSTLTATPFTVAPIASGTAPATTEPRATVPASPTTTPTADGRPTQNPRPTPTGAVHQTPSVRATHTPAPSGYPDGSVIVTFDVGTEQFRILVTDRQNIAIARKLLAGEEAPSIPNGIVVRGDTSVNTGWSWHIDPDSLEFADMTTEVCDGKPSFVENREITGDRFCPWSAEVVAVDPANS
jgi:hypothetical protein